MNVERKAVAALKWSAVAKLLTQLISWTVTLVVLRILAPADYGLMAIVTVIISIIAGVAEFGFGASLIQARTLDRQELARVAGALGAMNLGCGVLVASCGPLFASFFEEPRLELLIQVAALQFVFSAIEVVPQALLQRELNFSRIARIEVGATTVGSLSMLGLALADAGVWSLVLGTLIGGAVRAALFASSGAFVRPSWRLSGIRRHLQFGGTVTVTRILWQVTHQLDTLIAARFLSREALGLYSVAMHLATLPMNKAMGIVNQVALPAVARLQDELPRLRLRLLESVRLMALVAIPALWGVSAVAPEFVHVVLGSKWSESVIALQLVSLVAPLRMLMAVFATALAAIGRADLELRNTLVSALLLPASFAVGVHWELNGLAASWLIAVPLILTINFRRTFGPLGITFHHVTTAMLGPFLAGAAMFASVFLTRQWFPELDESLRLPILIVVGGTTYSVCAFALDRGLWSSARRVVGALRG